MFSDIEVYTNYLMNFIQQLMNLIVSLIKFFRKYSCSWWFLKVKNAVQQVRVICQ